MGAWPGLKLDRVLIIAKVFESGFSEPYRVLLDYLDFVLCDLRYDMKSSSLIADLDSSLLSRDSNFSSEYESS